jgi:hypothetical protein
VICAALKSEKARQYGSLMSNFTRRVDLAVEWFNSRVIPDGDGGAGWGWMPDVVPNPQNTAEVVCILARLDRVIPREQEVVKLIRRRTVRHASGNDWDFGSCIDVAWRLHALRYLINDQQDPDILECAQLLVNTQDEATGGWRMAGSSGPISITATCAAVLALCGLKSPANSPPVRDRRLRSLETPLDIPRTVDVGLRMLITAVLGDDPRADPLYANAEVAHLLSQPEIEAFGGERNKRAKAKAAGRVLAALEDNRLDIEDEVFTRGPVADSWRHLPVYLALEATAEAAPHQICEPAFRRALIRMLDLQEVGDDLVNTVNFGGFRTSEEGFVTTYATAHGLGVLAALETWLDRRVNPGSVFNLLSRSTGEHHTDPRDIVTFGDRVVTMNSYAGELLLATELVAAATVISLAICFKEQLEHGGTGLLLLLSGSFLANGIFFFVSARFPGVSKGRLVSAVLSPFVAFAVSIVVYILS